MRVKAAPGLMCPKEGSPREYINDDPKGVVVPDTSYYQRLLCDGSLLEVVAAPPTVSTVKTKGGDQ